MLNQNIFAQFRTQEFSDDAEAVYVIFVVHNNQELPFYVGQTNAFSRRMSDYRSANFQAVTDFKVGEAIKYFRSNNYKIIVKYKPTNDSKNEEGELIKLLKSEGYKLLNDLPGYNYKKAEEDLERKKIINFCDQILLKLNF